MTADTGKTPFGLDSMDTNWTATLHDLGDAAFDVFLWPGYFILSQLGTHAPGLALKVGIGIGGDSVALAAFVSGLAWSLLAFLAWKVLKTVFAHIIYAGRRLRAFLVGNMQKVARRRLLSRPVTVPDVDIDDLDMAILNTGATLPPGLMLTAAELSGQLIKRPDQLQRRLEKLRKYGLVDGALGETDGYDNYRLTRSGSMIVSMWHRQEQIAL
jgi:hypothetical protein